MENHVFLGPDLGEDHDASADTADDEVGDSLEGGDLRDRLLRNAMQLWTWSSSRSSSLTAQEGQMPRKVT